MYKLIKFLKVTSWKNLFSNYCLFLQHLLHYYPHAIAAASQKALNTTVALTTGVIEVIEFWRLYVENEVWQGNATSTKVEISAATIIFRPFGNFFSIGRISISTDKNPGIFCISVCPRCFEKKKDQTKETKRRRCAKGYSLSAGNGNLHCEGRTLKFFFARIAVNK